MDRLVRILARALIVFLYIPIVAVIVYSFNSSKSGARWGGFTFEWYGVLLRDQPLLETVLNSVIVGISAATLATVVGLLSAMGLDRYKGRSKAVFMGAILLPLIIPEIVLGVAMLTVFSTAKIPLGIPTMVLGHLIIALPLTTLIMLGAISALDPSLPEASVDLGCTPWQTFTRVLLPLLKSALLASWLLSFTTSFGNIVISTFTNGVGTTTMPLRIYSLLKTGLTPEINALGALLIAFTLLIILSVGVGQMRRIMMR